MFTASKRLTRGNIVSSIADPASGWTSWGTGWWFTSVARTPAGADLLHNRRDERRPGEMARARSARIAASAKKPGGRRAAAGVLARRAFADLGKRIARSGPL